MVEQLRGFGLTVEQAHYVADIYLVVDMTTAGGPLDDYWAPDTVDRIRADLAQKNQNAPAPALPAWTPFRKTSTSPCCSSMRLMFRPGRP